MTHLSGEDAPGRHGMAAMLTTFGTCCLLSVLLSGVVIKASTANTTSTSDLLSIEQKLCGHPVASGLSRSFDTSEKELTITRGTGGFGFRLVALVPPAPHGIYAGTVAPDGAAATAGLVAGMKILAVDGKSTAGLSEAEASKLVAGKQSVKLQVKYDPATFARIDRGLELRRISLLAFQGDWVDDGSRPALNGSGGDGDGGGGGGGAMYRGFRPLGTEMPTSDTIKQWLNSTRTAPDDGAIVAPLQLTVGNTVVVGRHGGSVETMHPVMDVAAMELDGSGLAIVLNEAVPGKTASNRNYVGHAYTFPDGKAAAQAHGTIVDRMTEGFDRVKQAIAGVFRPAVLQGAFDLDASVASVVGGAGVGS